MISINSVEIDQLDREDERYIHFYNVKRDSELALIQTGRKNPGYTVLIYPKIRDHYLLHFVRFGSGYLKLQDSTYHLSAGSCFLIYPNEIAWYHSDPGGEWGYYWIGISGTKAEEFISLLGFRPGRQAICYPQPYTFDMFPNLVDAAFLYQHDPIGLDLEVNSMLRHLIFSLSKEKDKIHIPPVPEDNTSLFGIGNTSDKYVNTVIMLIQNNYGEDIRVDAIANSLHLNRSYLSSLFKKNTGLSIKQYLLQYRIESAKRLLLETERTITEISFQCGFQDPLYFSRMFKNHTCQSPSDCRYQKKKTAT